MLFRSLDRQLAMATIHEHGELDFSRSSEIVQRIHRRPHGATAEEHIIHQHNSFARDVAGNVRRADRRRGVMAEIIAVHGNVERTGSNGLCPDSAKDFRETLREMHAASLHADEQSVCAGFISLGDFVRDAGEYALDGRGVEDRDGFRHIEKRGQGGRQTGEMGKSAGTGRG